MNRLLICVFSFAATTTLAQQAADPARLKQDYDQLMAGGTREEIRTWHVRDGRKVSGVIVDASKDQIVLEREGNRKLKVPLRLLTDADQARAKQWAAAIAAPSSFGKADEEVVIRTVFEQMKYDLDHFTVLPGSRVRLVLINNDQMAHNLMVLKPGKDVGMEVAQKAWALGEKAMARQYVPTDDRILAHSKIVGGFLSHAIYFTAPKTPGDYPFICSLPGHVITMNGVMTVSKHRPGLNNLTYAYYTGSWNKLPDWSKLQPAATGTLAKNLIDIKPRKTNDRFGFVFESNLVTPKKGKYTFHLGSDDGSSLDIDGKRVVTNDGVHGVQFRSGSVNLDSGSHTLRVAYFENSGGEELHVGWDGPGFKQKGLSVGYKKGGGGNKGGPKTGNPILVQNGEASMYRNFIEGGGTRAIGVGYPGDVNLTFDADNMFISMIWLGPFMDGAKHWNGRGQGFQPPSGHSVQKLVAGVPLAELSSLTVPWPDALRKSNELRDPGHFRFRGYRLDENRFPTFLYTWKNLQVSDFPKAVTPDLISGSPGAIKRSILIKGSAENANLYFLAAAGTKITKSGKRYEVDESYAVEIDNAQTHLREIGGKMELLVKVALQGGTAAFTQHYTWLNADSPESE
ncbi:MAG: PA14 domain-containing protein [Phycisphaerae bacterium]|nr:PA14 domain-containing protein [Phycisphaerae bacterium]